MDTEKLDQFFTEVYELLNRKPAGFGFVIFAVYVALACLILIVAAIVVVLVAAALAFFGWVYIPQMLALAAFIVACVAASVGLAVLLVFVPVGTVSMAVYGLWIFAGLLVKKYIPYLKSLWTEHTAR